MYQWAHVQRASRHDQVAPVIVRKAPRLLIRTQHRICLGPMMEQILHSLRSADKLEH